MTANQSGWKPTTPTAMISEDTTVTGNRALMLEEPLIFEIGSRERTGVDFGGSPAKAGAQGAAQAAPAAAPG
ncbi:MAG: aminomethyl-transferring glycine dehydrogenase subunit GcvPB, partial [Sphingomicrobium sp.]